MRAARFLLLVALVAVCIWFFAAVCVGCLLIASNVATRDDVISALLCLAMLCVCCGGLTWVGRR